MAAQPRALSLALKVLFTRVFFREARHLAPLYQKMVPPAAAILPYRQNRPKSVNLNLTR